MTSSMNEPSKKLIKITQNFLPLRLNMLHHFLLDLLQLLRLR